MSTPAQEQTTLATNLENDPAEPSTTPAPATAADAKAKATSSRPYTLFEEARPDTWTRLGEVEADTPEDALETLGEQKLKGQQRFMAIPSRFVRPVKPNVTTVTSISFG